MNSTNIEALALPIGEACRVLGVGRTKIYALIATKELPVIKIGRRTLITPAALRDFIAAKMVEAA